MAAGAWRGRVSRARTEMVVLCGQSAERLRKELEAQTHALDIVKQEMSAAAELRAQELQETIAR